MRRCRAHLTARSFSCWINSSMLLFASCNFLVLFLVCLPIQIGAGPKTMQVDQRSDDVSSICGMTTVAMSKALQCQWSDMKASNSDDGNSRLLQESPVYIPSCMQCEFSRTHGRK